MIAILPNGLFAIAGTFIAVVAVVVFDRLAAAAMRRLLRLRAIRARKAAKRQALEPKLARQNWRYQ